MKIKLNINCRVLSRLSVVQIPDDNDNRRIDNYDDNKSNGVFFKNETALPRATAGFPFPVWRGLGLGEGGATGGLVQGSSFLCVGALGRAQQSCRSLPISLQGHQPPLQGVPPGHRHPGRPLPGLEEEHGPGGRGDHPLSAPEDGKHQRVHPKGGQSVPGGHGGARDPRPLPGGPHLRGHLVRGDLRKGSLGR